MSAALDDILATKAKRRGSRWTMRCPGPGHDDKRPSLTITKSGAKYLVHCHAGCETEAVVSALGLSMADLFDKLRTRRVGRGDIYPPKNTSNSATPPNGRKPAPPTESEASSPAGCTLTAYAQAKRLPIDFLQRLGLSDMSYLGRPAVRVPYHDAHGAETAVRFRIALAGEDKFRWKTGAKPALYGLARIAEAQRAGYVVLVEGESDTQTLLHHGIPALGIPGAANWREDRDAPHLDNIATIYVVIEPDRGGEAVLTWLAQSRIRERVKLVRLTAHKDVSALHLADPAQFPAAFRAARDAAIPWPQRQADEMETARRDSWEACRTLAQEPRILDRFQADLQHSGVVGEAGTAKLLYLGVTSRVLDRPASIVVKGTSSSGKSFLVEQVLRFFPPAAYYSLSAFSEHALVYSDEPLIHRFLVIFEAVGIQGDLSTYLVRSLLSEGRVRYETVEKTKDGLKPRLIEREGPTGLIVTTTALTLHPENETRLISITIDDGKEQTKAVLNALADGHHSGPDLTRWHALQTWIASGPAVVAIPYAKILAESIPPLAVRLRRDFGAVLNLIRAHAILHQATRQRDDRGQIIATIEDYAVVRDLVAPLIAETIEAGVSETIRETVHAVETLCPNAGSGVSVATIAKELSLDKSAISRRLRAAHDRGYLKNLEDRKGRPARYVLGDPLPGNAQVLPAVEALRDRCTVAGVAEGVHPPSPPPTADRTASTPRHDRERVVL